ncbi:hypothetical protein HJFPF1_08991 [Paramyrothecium foliicola]|nr:hypothetical protein HJFPF1_08991 [Paramyrothecium foliicola]
MKAVGASIIFAAAASLVAAAPTPQGILDILFNHTSPITTPSINVTLPISIGSPTRTASPSIPIGTGALSGPGGLTGPGGLGSTGGPGGLTGPVDVTGPVVDGPGGLPLTLSEPIPVATPIAEVETAVGPAVEAGASTADSPILANGSGFKFRRSGRTSARTSIAYRGAAIGSGGGGAYTRSVALLAIQDTAVILSVSGNTTGSVADVSPDDVHQAPDAEGNEGKDEEEHDDDDGNDVISLHFGRIVRWGVLEVIRR